MVALLVALLAAAGAVAWQNGWLTLPGEEGRQPVHEENFQKPAEPPKFFPDGSAEQNLPYFADVLQRYAAGEGAIEGRPVVDAVVEAGFDRAAMQVSFDRTETNLVADNIFVSVRIGADCLVGQLVTADREAYAVVAPAVGPDADVCLIGETREIDGD